jgi:branched chain amino acid efflux pump
MWTAILVASAGCFALKLAGLSVPARLVGEARVVTLLPVALLAALVGLQTFSTGRELVLDARVAGLAAALVAVRLRAPFLVVVASAALTTALLRAVSS